MGSGEEMAPAWFVAAVKPQGYPIRGAPLREVPLVSGSLAAMHLARHGFKVYLPTLSAITIKRHIKTRVLTPMFNGYLFLEFDIDTDHWKQINSTIGVRHLLPTNSELPLALPLGFIEAIRDAVVTKNKLISAIREFSDNALVRFIAGPFAALEGRIERAGKRSSRVRIFSLTGAEFLVNAPNAALATVEVIGGSGRPARRGIQDASAAKSRETAAPPDPNQS